MNFIDSFSFHFGFNRDHYYPTLFEMNDVYPVECGITKSGYLWINALKVHR